MKIKPSNCSYILKVTVWVFCFFVSNKMTAMDESLPQVIDLTEEKKSIEAAQKESKTQILKQQRKKNCYDLMMIFDPNMEKKDPITTWIGATYCAGCLRAGFSEKSFPMIVSSNLIENYCSWKKGLGKSPFAWEVMYRFYPTDNDWYAYSHKKAPLILFVPKNYIDHFSQQTSIEQMNKCGFDVDNLDAFENLLPDTLLEYIAGQGLTNINDYSIRASDIESLFIKSTIPNLPSWNIYLTGHGAYSYGEEDKALIAGLQEGEFFKLMEVFEKIKTSFLFYCTCFSGGQNLIKVQKQLAKLTVNFMVGTQGINETVVAPLLGAHTPFRSTRLTDLFKKLETFFGNPDSFALQMQAAHRTNDPIAFLMTYAVTTHVGLLDSSQPWVYIPAAGVFNPFSVDKSIKILTNSLARAYEFEGKTIDFTESTIQTIIVCPNYIGIPLRIKAHVAIVSPTGLMITNEPIAFEKKISKKENEQDEWIAKESKSNILHVFEKIIYEDKLSSIIPNFISFHSSLFPIIFVIKELECFDYKNSGLNAGNGNVIILKNVIIFKYRIDSGRSSITVFFNYNDSTYSFSEEIINLAENSKKLFDQFNNLSASELNLDELNQLLVKSNLFKHCGLDDIGSDYVSLEMIVKYIESKINKDFVVQKPGALKKSLLLKQKNILEKSVNPLIKIAASEDIEKQKKFVAYAKNLPKRVEQSKELEKEIKKSPWGEITIKDNKGNDKLVSAQQIYLHDVAEIQQKLAHQHKSALLQQPKKGIEGSLLMSAILDNLNAFFSTVSKRFLEIINSAHGYIMKKISPYSKQR